LLLSHIQDRLPASFRLEEEADSFLDLIQGLQGATPHIFQTQDMISIGRADDFTDRPLFLREKAASSN